MITRPLDLASRLSAPPRNFDFLFLVNVGLVALFFVLFGSRFVLAPGMTEVPAMSGAKDAALITKATIKLLHGGGIITADGDKSLASLRSWLKNEAGTTKDPVLLIIEESSVTAGERAAVVEAAFAAGFKVQISATEPVAPK